MPRIIGSTRSPRAPAITAPPSTLLLMLRPSLTVINSDFIVLKCSVAFSSTALQEASRAATPSWRAVLACAAAGGAAAVLAHAHSEPTGTTAARFPPDEYHAPLYDIIAASEPKEPDLWDRWGQVKRFLWSWRRRAPTDVPLPTDKLACHVPPGGASDIQSMHRKCARKLLWKRNISYDGGHGVSFSWCSTNLGFKCYELQAHLDH